MTTAAIDELTLRTRVGECLNRWPAAGLAAAVVQNGSLEWFYGHGVVDIRSRTPITEHTVFRVASISKTFTAVAVMQLWEQGQVDLDAPANDYLRAYRLIPAKASFRPATLRHLLTHTAGIGALRGLSDLLRPTLGWGVRVGCPVPALADYYRRGVRLEIEPGTKWTYGNHGPATLGQIVEDVTGEPFNRYLCEHLFRPLGMANTDLVRSERVRPHLATGYVLRSGGLQAVTDREYATPGAASVYSTTRDMARYVAALLGGGANEHGSVLKPETVATMFEPQFQPDPRMLGMALGFFPGEVGGHRTVGHDGVLPGFLSQMVLAPDDGVGVLAFANTGGLDGRGAPIPLANALLRQLLGLAPDAVRTDVPEQPERWSELCGWYSPDPGWLTNLPVRPVIGAGVEVFVRRGQLTMRGLSPIPPVYRGVRLHADDDDPYAFRIDLSAVGMGTSPVVFAVGPDGRATALHLGLAPLSLYRRPDVRNPRGWVYGAVVAGASALAVRRRGVRERRRTDAEVQA